MTTEGMRGSHPHRKRSALLTAAAALAVAGPLMCTDLQHFSLIRGPQLAHHPALFVIPNRVQRFTQTSSNLLPKY
ncbi:hypothetical protein SAMN05216533_1344 [Streptomyces sp. Ag109_O5-10]|nr:hypothetical protein SAMN05216533_1344 [Streptomyces sp. Ag109_O5-10]